MKKIIFLGIIAFIAVPCFALDINSEVFDNGGYIPDRYTCDNQGYSPPLNWSNIPDNAKSLVLICDDPVADFQIRVHWILFNIPVDASGFDENVTDEELGKLSIIKGINDFGRLGYKGPCPPPGKARKYFFKLYALDTTLSLEEGADKKEVLEAIHGHILAEAKISGFYQKADQKAEGF